MKRLLDVVLVVLFLALFWWVYLVIAALVRVKLGGPVIFAQERPGRGEKPFRLYKFRSMTDARGEDGALLPDAERLTPFGQKLRSTSLDELPELFNILKGDMSIVGPRPLLMRYLPYYTAEERRRHDVRPGLTGLAQVSGRNFLNWGERFAIDVRYVDELSFALDVRILLRTAARVFEREDIMDLRGNTPRFGDLDEERRDCPEFADAGKR